MFDIFKVECMEGNIQRANYLFQDKNLKMFFESKNYNYRVLKNICLINQIPMFHWFIEKCKNINLEKVLIIFCETVLCGNIELANLLIDNFGYLTFKKYMLIHLINCYNYGKLKSIIYLCNQFNITTSDLYKETKYMLSMVDDFPGKGVKHENKKT